MLNTVEIRNPQLEDLYSLWWYHGMEILYVLLTICVGNHRASSDKGPVAENLDTALVTSEKLYWINSWIDVGLRRYTADVMLRWSQFSLWYWKSLRNGNEMQISQRLAKITKPMNMCNILIAQSCHWIVSPSLPHIPVFREKVIQIAS